MLDHLVPFLHAAFRLSGVFLLAPVLASAAIPVQARALLVAAMSVAVYPGLSTTVGAAGVPDVFALAWSVAAETFIGFSIGLLMMMPVAAVQLSGLLMGHQMGFGIAQVFNPALDTETDLLGELLSYLAVGIFLAIGGLEATFGAVSRTFEHMPIGSAGLSRPPLDVVVSVLHAGFELAIRVSLPLMAIIMIETVAAAFIMKTLPQANIMSIGFAIKIGLGLMAIIVGLRAMDTAIGDHVSEIGRKVLEWSGRR